MQPFSQQHPSSSSNAPNSAGNAQPQPNDVSITDPDASSQPQPQNVGPESGAAVMSAHSPAAGMQPMPFPGPYAYAPMPAAMGQEGGCTGAAAQPASAGPATEDTTYSTSTASTATTSTSTSTLAPDANPDKLPPLILAARRGDLPAFEVLLQGGQSDINQVDGKYGSTALMFAAEEGHLEVVKMLLAAGARVNDANANDGTTALMYAAWEGHIDVVELLVGWQGIKLGQTDSDGNTALHLAALKNKPDVLLCLLKAGAKINYVHARNGSTALTCAAQKGHIDVVELLVNRKGIDIDQKDSFGDTALHVAAFNNKRDVLLCLLEAGAQVNHVDATDGSTALILAVEEGHMGIVSLLVRWEGIDFGQTDSAGNTALDVAAFNNKPDVLLCLLKAGAQVNHVHAKDGSTALILAAEKGHIDVVRLLVDWKDIELDRPNSFGNTALHVAAYSNKPDVLLCLLEAGARVNHVNAKGGGTALILAAEEGHIDIVRLLVGWKGIELNNTTSGGYTALHFAAYSNKPEVVASLLEARAARQCVEQKGRTALALAYDEMHAAVIEVFVQHGEQLVDVDIFALPQNPFTIVIADLQNDRKAPVTDFLAPDQPMVFFNQLTKAMQEDGSGPSMLLWLRSMGMRAAAVQQVAHTFASANLAWPAQSGSGKSTNAQQRLAYCFNALSSLPRLGAGDKVALLYKAAGISAAATGRLSGVALRQLETLAALAGQAAAQLGAAMLDKLVPFCLAKIGLAYEVDSIALKSSLVDEGFCAPVAQAIALGWQAAIAALQTRNMTLPAGLTMA